MTTQWFMPTADCALPAGTKLLYVDDDSVSWFREVTAPCVLSVARDGISGRGRVFMRDGSRVPYLDDKRQACTAASLIVSQLFLPETEPAQAPPAPPTDVLTVGSTWRLVGFTDVPVNRCTVYGVDAESVNYRFTNGYQGTQPRDLFLKTFMPIAVEHEPATEAAFDPTVTMPEVKRDAYAEAHERLTERLRWEGHPAPLRSEGHPALDTDSIIAAVMVTEDNTIDRWEPTAPTAQRRLQLGLNSERPRVRPHPHEGRSERVYQKRLK